MECSICYEPIQNTRQSLTSLAICHHTFHTICIQTWSSIHPSCPLCRCPIEPHSVTNLLPTLMAMVIWMPIEDQLQRISFAFAYIRLILEFFPNSIEYNLHKTNIVKFSDSLTLDHYKLPLLCYTTRTDLQKQATEFKHRFHTLIGGVRLERHPFVREWKRRILEDYRASMFFYHKQIIEIGEPYHYQQPVEPHTS